jgi:5'-deoxynucleotidase YfbR-like HD superfamily hydrolase
MCRHELPHVQTWALLHDCHEIITGEIVRPAKTASVERLQDEIDWHIQSALGLKITAEHEMAVMRHDIDTGAAEYKYGDDMRYRYAGHDCVAIFDTMLTGRGGAF